MRSAKVIAVEEPDGHTSTILKKMLNLCGRTNFRVAPAGEPLRPEEQPAVLLLCRGAREPYTDKFPRCVARYEEQTQPLISQAPSVTYSTENDRADYTARNVRLTPEGRVAFEIVGAGVIGRVRLNGGDEWAEPALAAAAAAITAGVSFAEVLDALNTMPL